MSWGTDFKTDIYLDRIVFKNSYELDEKIEEVEQSLSRTKQLDQHASVLDDEFALFEIKNWINEFSEKKV